MVKERSLSKGLTVMNSGSIVATLRKDLQEKSRLTPPYDQSENGGTSEGDLLGQFVETIPRTFRSGKPLGRTISVLPREKKTRALNKQVEQKLPLQHTMVTDRRRIGKKKKNVQKASHHRYERDGDL